LLRCGYARVSVQLQLHLVAHLSRWLVGEGLEETGLNRYTIERFLTHRQAAGYTNYLSCKALAPLLSYLRGLGALPPASPKPPETTAGVLLERYGGYLKAERGLAASSARAYVDMARIFLAWRTTTGELDLEHLKSGDVTAFVLTEYSRRSSGSAKRDPAISAWMNEHSGELGAIARHWFDAIRDCGDDVGELLHDGHPTACIGDAAFAYVNVFNAHVNVGFFRGAELADPVSLVEGTGKYMRHVKLRPDGAIDATALIKLIESAYAEMKRRVAAE